MMSCTSNFAFNFNLRPYTKLNGTVISAGLDVTSLPGAPPLVEVLVGQPAALRTQLYGATLTSGIVSGGGGGAGAVFFAQLRDAADNPVVDPAAYANALSGASATLNPTVGRCRLTPG